MRVNLNKAGFNVMPGVHIPVNSVLWLDKNKEDWEIKYSYPGYISSCSLSYWPCFGEDPTCGAANAALESMLPKIISFLKKERSKYIKFDWEGIPNTLDNKIARIKLVRDKLGLGLRDAKEFVEENYELSTLEFWVLPQNLKNLSISPVEESKLVYLKDWGVFTIKIADQLKDLLDYQGYLTLWDFTPNIVYLCTSGEIIGKSENLILFYEEEELVKFNVTKNLDLSCVKNKLIDSYSTIKEANLCWKAFRKGVRIATKEVKERVLNSIEDFSPIFY